MKTKLFTFKLGNSVSSSAYFDASEKAHQKFLDKKFALAKVVVFNSDEPGYEKYNGKKAEILFKLSDEDVNHYYHTGSTYRIRFINSLEELDAFDFELEVIE